MSKLKRSTLSALTECADFADVSVVLNPILCGALTGNDDGNCCLNKHPALNGELFTRSSYKKL